MLMIYLLIDRIIIHGTSTRQILLFKKFKQKNTDVNVLF